jgi:lipopolysaccharide cholinephosphotransferase
MIQLVTDNWEEQYKQRLLSLLKSFQDLCAKYNLEYFAAYGTVIGAVRHHGLIPWDDDIDVYMPRESYDKLLEIFVDISSNDYELLTWHNKDYYQPFSKFCDLHSSICPFSDMSVIMGVYIDVFPLDRMNGSARFCSYYSAIYRRLIRLYKEKELKGKGLLIKKLVRKIEKWFLKGKKIVSTCGPYRQKEVFCKQLFENSIVVPFESLTIRVPSYYDVYLSQLYGDWHKLPPKEKQVSNHDIFYANFNSRLTREQIMQDIESINSEGIVVNKIVEENPYI